MLLRLSKGSMVVVVDFRHVVGIAQTPGENPTSTMLMSAATTSMDVVFLIGCAVVELQHLQYSVLWSPGENLRLGLPNRMTVLCPRQHYLLGGVILETQTTASVCGVWLRVVCLVVLVVCPTQDRWWCALLHVFLFGCLSCGLCPAAMHAQDPPLLDVVLRRASGSWYCIGSPFLNDDAMAPPQLANHLELSWRSSQSRFMLNFGSR